MKFSEFSFGGKISVHSHQNKDGAFYLLQKKMQSHLRLHGN